MAEAKVTAKATSPATLPVRSTAEHRGLCYFPKREPWNRHRPVKVIVIGAGIGGIASAVLISHKVRNATIQVYDRLPKVGGTWAANIYPGVRCDVPSHVYQLSFEPNLDWSEYYPKGAEIQQYYERIVAKHGLGDNICLQHEVLKAKWLPNESQWEVEVRNLLTGETIIDRAEFFINSQGRISEPRFPPIPGLRDTFKGEVIHTARWPKGFDHAGKRLAVIGNGASGQQLIPNIINDVAHIDHYVRSKTWVSPVFAADLFSAQAGQPGGPKYSEQERQKFRDDPAAYLEHRRKLEISFHQSHRGVDVIGSQANEELRKKITEVMLERLGGDHEWLARIIPDYAPGCKRLTPGPGYVESLKNPKLDYITEGISHVSETGVVTRDGKAHEVDAIITATGFNQGFTTLFPVIGKDGVDLREKWAPDGKIGYPETYLGVMAPGYPNYFSVLQAQGNARGTTAPRQIELTVAYIAKCIRKVQSQSYVALDPREDAVQEFNDIVNGFFDNSVTHDKCTSWFKQGPGAGRMLIWWPGTYHHCADTLRDPRWEDFEFQRAPGARLNRFEFFGNGMTKRDDEGEDQDLTNYLKLVGDIDLAKYLEAWDE
ncbi:FAD/NAD(P)-binding domain-containing protein [Ustulina deusta]|nr:FAD/NAD(P)-binding domain-containing protein [Ustulina deusta]